MAHSYGTNDISTLRAIALDYHTRAQQAEQEGKQLAQDGAKGWRDSSKRCLIEATLLDTLATELTEAADMAEASTELRVWAVTNGGHLRHMVTGRMAVCGISARHWRLLELDQFDGYPVCVRCSGWAGDGNADAKQA